MNAEPERLDPLSAIDREHAGTIAWLAARGADRIAHPGGTLLGHLRRTAHRLQGWGASRELTVAGLCHAAYGTHGFPAPLLDLAGRDALREQIGEAAEAIVYAYGACDREHARGSAVELRDRFGGEYWVPSDGMRRDLAELSVANELDVALHAELACEDVAAIGELVARVAPSLTPASWSSVTASPALRERAARAAGPRGDSLIAFRDLGAGDVRVLLWHGGAAPELTWCRQHALSVELALRIPWRRGFLPSIGAPRQDWEPDVRDLLRVMPEGAHVVAHSYGGPSALLAAALAPQRFASLTLIESPSAWVAPDDPEVRELAALARAFGDGAPEARKAFLAIAGLPEGHAETRRTERIARGFRDPSQAVPDLARLRASGLPIAVVSGAHNRAIERVCDALADALAAERWVLPGAGHAAQRVPEFNPRLRAWIATHGSSRS